jgi:hypothetical protein
MPKSPLHDYIVFDRGNPMKYLYDSLDAYFQVAKSIAYENVNINDIMLMRVWAANDVVNAALGVDLVEKEDFNNELKALMDEVKLTQDSGIPKTDSLRNDIMVSAFKIQIVLRYLNERNPKKVEMKA